MTTTFNSPVNTNLHPEYFQFKNNPSVSERTIEDIQNGELLWSSKYTEYPDYNVTNKFNKKKNYAASVLTGIQELSPLSKLFFSEENIDNLQKLIRYNVYLQSDKKYVISNQNLSQLLIVMRSTYLSYSKYTCVNLTKSIEILNNAVINDILPTILSNILQYVNYRTFISQPVNILERGVNANVKGDNQLRGFMDVLLGDKYFIT